jgi:hypothetical protein
MELRSWYFDSGDIAKLRVDGFGGYGYLFLRCNGCGAVRRSGKVVVVVECPC